MKNVKIKITKKKLQKKITKKWLCYQQEIFKMQDRKV